MESTGEVLANVNVDNTYLNNVERSNVKSIDNVKTNPKQVEAIAYKLGEVLNDSTSFNFFCKVAWKLQENVIWNNVEVAKSKRNPRAYFATVCKAQMSNR